MHPIPQNPDTYDVIKDAMLVYSTLSETQLDVIDSAAFERAYYFFLGWMTQLQGRPPSPQEVAEKAIDAWKAFKRTGAEDGFQGAVRHIRERGHKI